MARAGTGGNQLPLICYDARGNGGNVAPTITGDHENRVTDYTAIVVRHNAVQICAQNTGQGWWNESDIAQTLRTPCGGDSTKANIVVKYQERGLEVEENIGRKYVIRRLTPTECARLQGFPDWWVDGADGSDTAIYKMWGNGIALPCAADVLGRIAKEIESGQEGGE